MIATDSDREGEAIARLIINLSGNSRKTIKRLWINSLETSEIKKGFQNLKDGQAFYSTYKEAETRQIADWLVGINLTRLYPLYMQKNGMRGVFSVGRVQTPTLFLIYQRNEEIKHFVSKPFYELYATFTHSNGKYKGTYKKRFDTLENLDGFKETNQLEQAENAEVTNVKVEENGSMRRNSLACLIYNLSRTNASSTVPTKRFRSLKNSMKKRCFLTQEATPIISGAPNLTI